MATFFDPSTIAGWFDDGQVLRAYLGDRSRHAVVASGFGASLAPMLSEGNINLQVASTGVQPGTIAQNGGGWQLMASVFKYGAAGSNTQIGIHNQAIVSTAVAPVAPSLIA